MTLYKESIAHEIEADLNGRNQNWNALDSHLAESANKAHGGIKGALLRKGATQLIPNDATTVLTWSDVVYNTDSIYDAGSPTRLTIPSGISKITIVASVGFHENTSGRREVHIFKNGNGSYYGRASSTVVPVAGTGTVVQISSPILTVVAGDYFEIAVLQNSGDSLNITDWYNIWFAIEAIE